MQTAFDALLAGTDAEAATASLQTAFDALLAGIDAEADTEATAASDAEQIKFSQEV